MQQDSIEQRRKLAFVFALLNPAIRRIAVTHNCEADVCCETDARCKTDVCCETVARCEADVCCETDARCEADVCCETVARCKTDEHRNAKYK